MACREHWCRCGHIFFDNHYGGPCPECGSMDVTNHSDESEPEPEDEEGAQ